MDVLSKTERAFLADLSELAYCNPFLPKRIELERKLLGTSHQSVPAVWSFQADKDDIWKNATEISNRLFPLAEKVRDAIANGSKPTAEDMRLYEDLVLYMLYDKYRGRMNDLLVEYSTDQNHTECRAAWKEFLAELNHFVGCHPNPKAFQLLDDPEHVWAVFFQIRRLFHYVFYCIVGTSTPAAQLRGAIWQSAMTHNLRRYVRSLHHCMGDISTLITGPSGSGKELVARAIALSQYVPFDSSSGKFAEDYSQSMLAMHLAAMSPTLIESELFGHRKGAFTGATGDRKGLFETCSTHGTVFLDEIGELGPEIQVKLLRVLQTRTFQRLGDLANCQFTGKVIAATNRDFASEMQAGNFREDLYYRLCSDMIQTPSLSEQLASQPDDLRGMVLHCARQLTKTDCEPLADEVVSWINENLGPSYPWPGNVRELEQCLRNVMIRGVYRPASQGQQACVRKQITEQFQAGALTAEELLVRYCTMIYAQTNSYEEAARRLKIDRRTVKSKVDTELLGELAGAQV